MATNHPKSITNPQSCQGVRVRIAPSPTGWLHIGLARTALFNYLFAKKNQGKFILRIEDTDIERSDKKYEKDILENLKWLGLNWDEGPYRQSQRTEIYQKYIKKLLDSGQAFWCLHTKEELEAEKNEQMSRGEAPRHICDHVILSPSLRSRVNPVRKRWLSNGVNSAKNPGRARTGSFGLRPQDDNPKKGIIRFSCPSKKLTFTDLIRGKLEFDCGLLGDIGIARDEKTPLYNLAVVIDDYKMKISHIIRGEDHIPNTPKQILLQRALGFPQPKYAHLPLILGPDRSKLSKRHGAISISRYKKQGYLPEAMINLIALLGWNPGTEKEIFSLEGLIKEFSLGRVQKGGAVFNISRLDWLNGYYIRQMDLEELTRKCIPYLEKAGLIVVIKGSPRAALAKQGCPRAALDTKFRILDTGEIVDFEWLKKIVVLEQERLKKLSEIGEITEFFFKDKLEYKPELLIWKKMSLKQVKENLDILEEVLSKMAKFDQQSLKRTLMPLAEKRGSGELLWPLRTALTGCSASPGPFEVAEVLGKEKTLKRIREAICLLSSCLSS